MTSGTGWYRRREPVTALLVVSEGGRQSRLDQLRRTPTRVSGPSLIAALRRLEEIRALGVAELNLSRIPAGRLKALARHAATSWATVIARMLPDRRVATLLAFARAVEATALDDALDLLDLIITELLAQARLAGEKERLRTLGDLDTAALQLRDVCAVLLDEACSPARVRSLAFARVLRAQLAEALALVERLARPPEDDYQSELLNRYRRVRRFWPYLLRTVVFQGMCVLQRLQESLRHCDVFVERSERWGDPRAKVSVSDRGGDPYPDRFITIKDLAASFGGKSRSRHSEHRWTWVVELCVQHELAEGLRRLGQF